MTREHQTTALLALWNDVEPALDELYNDWHANEHVPERLTVPGILWARRYAARPLTPGQRYLTLYGLHSARVLDSAPYRHLLANPTPMSARMRPHLQNICRWVCDVRAKHGDFRGPVLQLFKSESEAEARCVLQAFNRKESAESILAQRIWEAAPLPWLNEVQGKGGVGNWLTASSGGQWDGELPVGVFAYEQRPVKEFWSP